MQCADSSLSAAFCHFCLNLLSDALQVSKMRSLLGSMKSEKRLKIGKKSKLCKIYQISQEKRQCFVAFKIPSQYEKKPLHYN